MKALVEIAPLANATQWRCYLSDKECEQVEQKANPVARARFEIGRGLRRKMLSEVVGVSADKLRFVDERDGKPQVLNADGCDFNISHSGDYVAVAVAQVAVGVDIEKIRPVREMDSIVARYFHPDEGEAWRSIDAGLREEAFFLLWSAREAAMKCTGLGLARGLGVTRVDPTIVSSTETGAQAGNCLLTVRRVEAPEGYVAVVALMAAR